MPARSAAVLRRLAAPRRLLVTSSAEQPAVAPSALPWPTQVEEVTPEWLTSTLQGTAALPPGATVRGFAAAVLPSGPLSRVHRLRLDVDGGGADAASTLVLKTAPPRGDGADDGARLLAAANRSFEREVGFLKAMATEKPPLPSAPLAFFAACDKASGRAALLMEDCEAAGAVRADSPVLGGGGGGVAEPHALCADAAPALVRALAAQHARFWGGGPFALWRWLPEINASIVRDFEPALCAAALPDALARFGDVVPAQLRGALGGLPSAAAGPILARLASGPRTLLHGSAVAANIFAPRGVLAGAEDGCVAAPTVRFVDYADAAAGRGALDVARLLASALDPDDRAEREHGLLGEYHEALVEGGVTAYSMYDAWEDYRFGVAYSLVGAVAAAGAPGLSAEADPAAWAAARVRLRRAAEAANDVGCAALMAGG